MLHSMCLYSAFSQDARVQKQKIMWQLVHCAVYMKMYERRTDFSISRLLVEANGLWPPYHKTAHLLNKRLLSSILRPWKQKEQRTSKRILTLATATGSSWTWTTSMRRSATTVVWKCATATTTLGGSRRIVTVIYCRMNELLLGGRTVSCPRLHPLYHVTSF